MSITYHDSTGFIIANLNAALEEHLAWSRKVLRCAVLHELPSNDVLDPMAHTLCGFSRWYALNKVHFYELDSDGAFHLEAVHKTMHDAIRAICSALQTNEPGSRAEMERFEQAQTEFIELISQFKTGFLTEAAMHDPLTGLRLRFGVESEFSQIQKTCLRNNLQLYSAIIDIDHFKWVNDRYGHPIGDGVWGAMEPKTNVSSESHRKGAFRSPAHPPGITL